MFEVEPGGKVVVEMQDLEKVFDGQRFLGAQRLRNGSTLVALKRKVIELDASGTSWPWIVTLRGSVTARATDSASLTPKHIPRARARITRMETELCIAKYRPKKRRERSCRRPLPRATVLRVSFGPG